MLKVVVFEVNEDVLKESKHDFESEMGWLHESGIYYKQIYDIPKELESSDPIEVLYTMKHLTKV